MARFTNVPKIIRRYNIYYDILYMEIGLILDAKDGFFDEAALVKRRGYY